MEPIFLYKWTKIASPTAASAAATAMMHITINIPSGELLALLKVIKERLTAPSIISMHRKTTMAFLRVITPPQPIVKSIADKMR